MHATSRDQVSFPKIPILVMLCYMVFIQKTACQNRTKDLGGCLVCLIFDSENCMLVRAKGLGRMPYIPIVCAIC